MPPLPQPELRSARLRLREVRTDEFIAYTKQIGPQLGLDETTAFLVVAATLLDLKAARLLPAGQVDDE